MQMLCFSKSSFKSKHWKQLQVQRQTCHLMCYPCTSSQLIMSNYKHAFDCGGEPGLMKALSGFCISKCKVFETTFSDSETGEGHKHKLCSTPVKINAFLSFNMFALTLVKVDWNRASSFLSIWSRECWGERLV